MPKNKRSTTIVVFLVLIGIVAIAIAVFVPSVPEKNGLPASHVTANQAVASPKDAMYMIEGQSVTLTNGASITAVAPGSASVVTTQYFGDDVMADFDGDGRIDTAFILTQNTGGSGTFYYVVVALNTINGYVGSSGFLIGDRITPQTLEASNIGTSSKNLIVNYMDRKPTDDFATSPSVAKSLYLSFNPQTKELVSLSPSTR